MRAATGGHGRLSRVALAALALGTILGGQTIARQEGATPPPPLPALEGPSPAPAPAPVASDPNANAPEGVEILTRGPVHEAFAEPVVFDPAPGLVIAKEPPPAVEELPPAQKPEGDDVEWIPGYWAWDEAREDFVWVSGIWRRLPPGRQWIPGYWAKVEGGFQWVSGYWAPLEQEQVEFLATPPATLEAGPNVPAPGEDYFWSPGVWTWYEQRYVWSPGCWVQTQPDWIWIPPTYLATPAGCVFVPGYWDFAVANRGMLFAPAYFGPAYFAAPAVAYTPSIVINIGILTDHFFCRPRYNHYFFGDYYAFSGAGGMFQPWFAFHERGFGYDPIYAWSSARFARVDPGWNMRIRETYRERVIHQEYRPPHTFLAQQRWIEGRQEAGARDAYLARTLAQVETAGEIRNLRLEKIDDARRLELSRRRDALDQFRVHRAELEAANQARVTQARAAAEARRVALPRSPLVANRPAATEASRAAVAEALQRRNAVMEQLTTRRAATEADARARLEQQRAAQAAELQKRREQQSNLAEAVRQRQGSQAVIDQQARQAIVEQREAAQAAQAATRQQRLDTLREQQQAAQAAELQKRQELRRQIQERPQPGVPTRNLGPQVIVPGGAGNAANPGNDGLRQLLEQRRQQTLPQQIVPNDVRRVELQGQIQQRQQQMEAARQQQAAQAAARQQQLDAARQQQLDAARQQQAAARQQQLDAARQQQAVRQQQANVVQLQQQQRLQQLQAAQAAARQQQLDAARQQQAVRQQQAAQGAAARQQQLDAMRRQAQSRQPAPDASARSRQFQERLQNLRQQRSRDN